MIRERVRPTKVVEPLLSLCETQRALPIELRWCPLIYKSGWQNISRVQSEKVVGCQGFVPLLVKLGVQIAKTVRNMCSRDKITCALCTQRRGNCKAEVAADGFNNGGATFALTRRRTVGTGMAVLPVALW